MLLNPIGWKKELLVCLLLSIAFGIFVCTASNKLDNREAHRTEAVELERAIFRGQSFHSAGRLVYMPPWQNRVLFPALLEMGIRLGIFGADGWYLLLRFLLSIAMFAAFWFALSTNIGAGFKLAGIGLLLLAYGLVCTFESSLGMTSDFPDAMFTTFFIVVSLRRKRLLLFILSIVAATNRESSAFAGVIWFFLYAVDENRKINWREAGYAAFVSISSYASVIALRFIFGGAQAIKSDTQYLPFRNNYYQIKTFITHPTPFSWVGLMLCMMLPSIIWIISNRSLLTFIHKRLLASACVIAAISVVFGNIGVPRIFIPSLMLTIFVAVWAEMNRKPSYVGQPELVG